MLQMSQQDQPLPARQTGGSFERSSGNLDTYRFTFDCKSTKSIKGSCLDPDTNPDGCEGSESLTDSVQNFPEQFGRTYHAYRAGSYAFPNDVQERERLSLQNEVLLRLFDGRLFFAPLNKKSPPKMILDVATGTGEWAIQMGDSFPHSQVIATDLSPIQPGEVPPNVNFYVEDSSEPWDYSQKFDYIHTRVTAGCWASFKIQVADQAFEALNPGGWFESHEFDADICCDDGTMNPEGAMARWCRDMVAAGEAIERPVVVGKYLKAVYEEAGFVDIQEKVFKVPTNGWPKDERLKELGKMWEMNFMQGLSGFSFGMFNRAYDRSAAEIEVSLVEVRRELSDTRIHAYQLVHVVCGRKPYLEE